MKRIFISAAVFLAVLSFSAGFSGAQSLDASFFLRPPAEVAQDLFQKMISMKPDDGDYMLQAGVSYWEKGQRAKAEDLFARALKASPKSYKISLRIGTAYLQKGENQKAEEMIQQAIQNKPKEENLYLEAGLAYLQARQGGKAARSTNWTPTTKRIIWTSGPGT
jgi:tetratricopeptide (TPR) repeat protein